MHIEIIKGDITSIHVDAIVNAANSSLLGGGGVDGAIHRVGGEQILEECLGIRNRQGACPVGDSVITNAGNLPALKVIHTVGPIWKDGNASEEEKLKSCYLTSLSVAEENNLKTLAYPNISTGVYNFPKERAAEIAISTVRQWKGRVVEKIVFVCFDQENFDLYNHLIFKSGKPNN